ncbi:MAG: hypothetical protein WBQ85_19600 [Candidatus Sulfotelmatobacter sp.]
MTDPALPTHGSKGRPWWFYLVFALAAMAVLVAAAFFTGVFGLTIFLSRLSDRGYVGTPTISGEVVDIVSGERVRGMNVCLLETYKNSGPTDGAGPWTDVRLGEVTQTDAAGIFSFAASKAPRDFFQSEDRYSISITEPVGDLFCSIELVDPGAGRGRVFENEPSESAEHRRRHYFPLAIVNDPGNPPPVARSTGFSIGNLPPAVFFRKIGDPAHLKVELIPLVQSDSECEGAYDTVSVALCKQANNSASAEKWRAALRNHP